MKLGAVRSNDGESLPVEISMEGAPSVVWDAMIVPDGADAIEEGEPA